MGEENIIKDKTETKGMSNQKKILSLQGLRAVMFFLIFLKEISGADNDTSIYH